MTRVRSVVGWFILAAILIGAVYWAAQNTDKVRGAWNALTGKEASAPADVAATPAALGNRDFVVPGAADGVAVPAAIALQVPVTEIVAPFMEATQNRIKEVEAGLAANTANDEVLNLRVGDHDVAVTNLTSRLTVIEGTRVTVDVQEGIRTLCDLLGNPEGVEECKPPQPAEVPPAAPLAPGASITPPVAEIPAPLAARGGDFPQDLDTRVARVEACAEIPEDKREEILEVIRTFSQEAFEELFRGTASRRQCRFYQMKTILEAQAPLPRETPAAPALPHYDPPTVIYAADIYSPPPAYQPPVVERLPPPSYAPPVTACAEYEMVDWFGRVRTPSPQGEVIVFIRNAQDARCLQNATPACEDCLRWIRGSRGRVSGPAAQVVSRTSMAYRITSGPIMMPIVLSGPVASCDPTQTSDSESWALRPKGNRV